MAIQDCRTALALDPRYAKAYGRMGVALSCQNRYDQAVEAYKHALELDPDNESYSQNLAIAEEKLAEAQTAGGGTGAAPAGFPGELDLHIKRRFLARCSTAPQRLDMGILTHFFNIFLMLPDRQRLLVCNMTV